MCFTYFVRRKHKKNKKKNYSKMDFFINTTLVLIIIKYFAISTKTNHFIYKRPFDLNKKKDPTFVGSFQL